MKSLTILSAAVMIILASCSSTAKTMTSKETTNDTPLYETKWVLKKIYTDEGIRDIDTKAFIRFDKEKNSAGGNGSCNTFGSTTTINGNEVSFKNVFSTKMYCEAVQNIEDLFFRQLEKATRFEIKGKKLLISQENKLLLEFQAQP